jgi:uncharacterized protein YndB with AHSA1/START domain
MSDERDGRPIQVEIDIDASPEEVFEHLADLERFPGWGGSVVLGPEVERDPPRRVAFEVEVSAEGERYPGRVEIILAPSQGGTRVRVVHLGLPEARLGAQPRAVGALPLAA